MRRAAGGRYQQPDCTLPLGETRPLCCLYWARGGWRQERIPGGHKQRADRPGRRAGPAAAGTLALDAGQADWVRELASQVLTVTTGPEQSIAARMLAGWALIWSNRHADALATLVAVAAEASDRLPVIAWNAIGLAGTAAYHWGTPAGYQAALSTLDGMHEPVQPPADLPPASVAKGSVP
jgi:hypothetical protein